MFQERRLVAAAERGRDDIDQTLLCPAADVESGEKFLGNGFGLVALLEDGPFTGDLCGNRDGAA